MELDGDGAEGSAPVSASLVANGVEEGDFVCRACSSSAIHCRCGGDREERGVGCWLMAGWSVYEGSGLPRLLKHRK